MPKEVYEKFGGVNYRLRHNVRSLASARKWEKVYRDQGMSVRIEREKRGVYLVFTRRR
jgi:predicted ATP-grasp superfamily ATP-dependent carboligase